MTKQDKVQECDARGDTKRNKSRVHKIKKESL